MCLECGHSKHVLEFIRYAPPTHSQWVSNKKHQLKLNSSEILYLYVVCCFVDENVLMTNITRTNDITRQQSLLAVKKNDMA